MEHRFALAFAFLLPLAACASDTAWAAPAPVHAPALPSSALAEALESISADALRADLYFIASDQLKGRDTPSEGLQIAARFLRARLQRLGLQPGGPDGSYFYTWQLEKKALDPQRSRLAIGAQQLELGKDYFLSGFGATAGKPCAGRLVFAGEATKEQIEKLEVEGRWVLIVDREQELRDARRELGRKKAAGLVFVPAADYAGKPYAERFQGELARQVEGRTQPAFAPAPEGGGREAEPERPRGLTALYLGPTAKQALLAAAATDEKQLVPGSELAVDLAETRVLQGKDGLIDVENVCGFWPGSDPRLKNEVILVTAHYDHVGVNRRGEIHNGADDNGSGTCGLLALAEALTRYGPMRRSVLIMWVAGEEKGLWGSEAWTRKPWLPEGCKPVADINIDMIGRNAPDKLLVTPSQAHEKFGVLSQVAYRCAAEEGFPALGSADKYYERSDHFNFIKAGIPATFLFSDVHEDYHQPGDDPEKIDYDKVRRVTRLVFRMLDALQADTLGAER